MTGVWPKRKAKQRQKQNFPKNLLTCFDFLFLSRSFVFFLVKEQQQKTTGKGMQNQVGEEKGNEKQIKREQKYIPKLDVDHKLNHQH